MAKQELHQRTKTFALRVIQAVQSLPPGKLSDVLGTQLLRCGTSVGANYRAACRAKSSPDFINKLKIVEEECDESIYWMELITESELIPSHRMEMLRAEAGELLAITVAAIRTSRSQHKPQPIPTFVNRNS